MRTISKIYDFSNIQTMRSIYEKGPDESYQCKNDLRLLVLIRSKKCGT